MCLKVNLCHWNMLVFTTLCVVLDLSSSQTIRSTTRPEITTKSRPEITNKTKPDITSKTTGRSDISIKIRPDITSKTTDSPDISTETSSDATIKIKVTKPSTILQLITHRPQTNHNCTAVSDFEMKTSNCLKDAYREKWILHIFKYKRDNSMFTDLLKQITCSQYKNALQCVHDIWTSCKNEETTAIVQDYLSREVPLQYNALCDINQHSHRANTSKQQQQLEEDRIHTPLAVHFTEKLTYKWEREVTIPETDLKDKIENSEDGMTAEDIDKHSKIIHDLSDWSTNIRNLSEEKHINKEDVSESLKYVHTKITGSDKVKYRSTLHYKLRKKQV